jgi:hypothetical protein
LGGPSLDRHGKIFTMAAVSYFACAAEGKKLRSDRDAVDLIGEAHRADSILIPAEQLDYVRTGSHTIHSPCKA